MINDTLASVLHFIHPTRMDIVMFTHDEHKFESAPCEGDIFRVMLRHDIQDFAIIGDPGSYII